MRDGLPPIRLCASSELVEGGLAHGFGVLAFGRESARGFALRFDGRVVAYLNQCMHVPTELDWQPGRFLDDTGRWIICATHGALYEPSSGVCVSGPCVKRRLWSLDVREEQDSVYWYPSSQFRPADSV